MKNGCFYTTVAVIGLVAKRLGYLWICLGCRTSRCQKRLGYKNYKAKQRESLKAKKEPWELNISEDHEGFFIGQLGLKDSILTSSLHPLPDLN